MRSILVVVVATLTLGGCGSPSPGAAPPTTPPPPTTTTATPTSAPATGSTAPSPEATPSEKAVSGPGIKAASSDYGKVLFDSSGQAIYVFAKETTSRAQCYGACAVAWPPVLTKGEAQAIGGVSAKLLGSIRRRDGSRQVTYQGRPLYFYAHEGKDEVRCHKVSGFGGLWLAVTPSGEPAA